MAHDTCILCLAAKYENNFSSYSYDARSANSSVCLLYLKMLLFEILYFLEIALNFITIWLDRLHRFYQELIPRNEDKV